MLPDGIHAQILPPAQMHQCCDTSSARYALANLCVNRSAQEGQVWASATDGRVLAVQRCEGELEPGLAQVLVPAAVAKQPRLKRDHKKRAILNGRWERADKLAEPVDPDSRYPRVHEVLPAVEAEKSFLLTINADLLQQLAHAISESGDVTLILPAAPGSQMESAIAVIGDQGFGCMMPLSDGGSQEAQARGVARICERFTEESQAFTADRQGPAKAA